jgi:hypothetical protein
MADAAVPPPIPADAAATQSSNAQTIVALAVIAALTFIAAGCLICAYVDHAIGAIAFGVLGVIVGGLINALSTPSGIGSVISQAKKPAPPTVPITP